MQSLDMQTANNYDRYKEAKVNTASPVRVIILLYDGAINFTNIAQRKMEQRDIPGKATYIHKTQAIITELLHSLNKEAGGEIALRLEQLYLFMLNQLVEANCNNDPKPLEVVKKLLSTLKEGWEGVIK